MSKIIDITMQILFVVMVGSFLWIAISTQSIKTSLKTIASPPDVGCAYDNRLEYTSDSIYLMECGDVIGVIKRDSTGIDSILRSRD